MQDHSVIFDGESDLHLRIEGFGSAVGNASCSAGCSKVEFNGAKYNDFFSTPQVGTRELPNLISSRSF